MKSGSRKGNNAVPGTVSGNPCFGFRLGESAPIYRGRFRFPITGTPTPGSRGSVNGIPTTGAAIGSRAFLAAQGPARTPAPAALVQAASRARQFSGTSSGLQKQNTKHMKAINTAQTVAVKITSSCLIDGQHLQEGLCFEVSPKHAAELEIASRATILRIRPSQSEPRTPQLIAAA